MKENSIKNRVKTRLDFSQISLILGKGLLFVLLLTSATAHSSSDSLYIGGQLVYVKNPSLQSALPPSSIASEGFLFSEYKPNGSSEFAVGFQFNDRGAFEIGYLQLNQVLPKSWVPKTVNDDTTTFHINAVSFSAKSILPLDPARSVYAKLGGAYIINFANYSNTNKLELIDKPEKISLTFSVGGSAEITEKLKINIAWTWVFAPSLLLPSMADSVNFLAIGASFHLS